jgi:hypothetical protein
VDGSVTQIELSDKAATYFPDFLDFAYWSTAFAITTRNAVALCFLAQYFMVPSLQEKANAFIRKDLIFSNVGTYMSDAVHFEDKATSCRVMEKCAEEVMQQVCARTNLSRALFSSPISSVAEAEERYKPLWLFLTRFPNVVVARVRKRTTLIFNKNT